MVTAYVHSYVVGGDIRMYVIYNSFDENKMIESIIHITNLLGATLRKSSCITTQARENISHLHTIQNSQIYKHYSTAWNSSDYDEDFHEC